MPNGTPDYQKMQQDAEQRLRDMQKRADRAVHSHDMPPVPNFVRMNKQNSPFYGNRQPQQPKTVFDRPPTHEARPPSQPKSESKKGIFGRLSGLNILKALNFQNIHIDNDVLIIIALIFLLSSEETDELLLLALVYIML